MRQAKVADFGLLKRSAGMGVAMTTAVAGTPGYMDPEYFSSHKVTTKSDVYRWGLGWAAAGSGWGGRDEGLWVPHPFWALQLRGIP